MTVEMVSAGKLTMRLVAIGTKPSANDWLQPCSAKKIAHHSLQSEDWSVFCLFRTLVLTIQIGSYHQLLCWLENLCFVCLSIDKDWCVWQWMERSWRVSEEILNSVSLHLLHYLSVAPISFYIFAHPSNAHRVELKHDFSLFAFPKVIFILKLSTQGAVLC